MVVAPLVGFDKNGAATRLHPSLTVLDRQYLLIAEELAAIPRQNLGVTVGSAESQRYDIVAALDLLFTGVRESEAGEAARLPIAPHPTCSTACGAAVSHAP